MAIPAHKQPLLERWSAPVRPHPPPPLPATSREPPLQAPSGQGRGLFLAFLVALAVHILAAVVLPGLLRREGTSTRFPFPVATSDRDAIELVLGLGEPGNGDAAATAPAPAAPPASRPAGPAVPAPRGAAPNVEAPALGAPGAVPAPGAQPTPGDQPVTGAAPAPGGVPTPEAPPAAGGSRAAGRSAVERLRPGTPDRRLWTLDPKATDLNGEQLLRLELLWAIEDMNAEAAAAAAAAKSLTDWTYTDSSGKRWGFADGKVYLGDLVLPFPFAFGAPPNSPEAQRAWVDAEIDRAAGSSAARANLKERVKAIRERLDAERQKARADSTKAPPKP